MELNKVYFDSYRSLHDAHISIHDPCLALVGINESGKTNILRALQCLSPKYALSERDRPKLPRTDPCVRFEFSLTRDEIQELRHVIESECPHIKRYSKNIIHQNTKVTYSVEYDLESEVEHRTFTLTVDSLPKNTSVLSIDYRADKSKCRIGDKLAPIGDVLLISPKDLSSNQKTHDASRQLEEAIKEHDALLDQLKEHEPDAAPVDDSASVSSPDNPKGVNDATEQTTHKQGNESNTKSQQASIQNKVKLCKAKIDKLAATVAQFDLYSHVASLTEKRENILQAIQAKEHELSSTRLSIEKLEATEVNPEQKKQLADLKVRHQQLQKQIQTESNSLEEIEEDIEFHQTPIDQKFTGDNEDLGISLGEMLDDALDQKLPKVVFWTYRDDYILSESTEFDQILSAKHSRQISRPLLNLFRIGTGVKNLAELKELIGVIRVDLAERTRYLESLTDKVNKYLASVWPDYDQRLKITLEQDRINVLFYDPANDDARYYNMQERSQGCQSFISFLLTVGAEAKKGVIRDTILLLDEPETHLHPSGVRHMRNELITAANNGNVVIFATHSVFMIDHDHYDRHLIVRKKREVTSIEPSSRDRIGYFMQEEVLYGALDINLVNSFPKRGEYNFVAEGLADILLLEKAYLLYGEKYGCPSSAGDACTEFYQGGKCTDIIKYIRSRPLQMGSTWVFAVDKDDAGNKLSSFVGGSYKKYIDRNVFVFQYSLADDSSEHVVLEDLLPWDLIVDALQTTLRDCDLLQGKIDLERRRAYSKLNSEFHNLGSESEKIVPILKKTLNEFVEKRVSGIEGIESFESTFPEYTAWVKPIIEKIGNGINEKS